MEMANLSIALLNYQHEYGSLPPCMAKDDPDRIAKLKLHLRRAFPRNKQEDGWPADLALEQLDPAESLVFFLGGLPSNNGPRRCLGISADVSDPFNRSNRDLLAGAGSMLYEFDFGRLTDLDSDGFWEYVPHGSSVPYVYFNHESYGHKFSNPISPQADFAIAYKATHDSWYCPSEFQLVSAGPDNAFGTKRERVFPSEVNFVAEDYDNQTNFLDISFGEAILGERLDRGYGRLSSFLVPLVAMLTPPCIIFLWYRKGRMSVKQMLIGFAIIALIMGALAWDANGLGRSFYLPWLRSSTFSWSAVLFLLSSAAMLPKILRLVETGE